MLPFLVTCSVGSRLVDRRRSPIPKALMKTFLIVKPEVTFDAGSGFRHRRVVFQVHLLVFERTPQALDENVARAAPPPVHADRDRGRYQFSGKPVAGELRPLIAVENIRPPPPQSTLQRLGRNPPPSSTTATSSARTG